MKIVRREFKSDGKHIAAYFVYCPACKKAHRFIVENEQDPSQVWTFDGDIVYPNFNPSLLVESPQWDKENERWGPPDICHSYMRNGVWHFLGDCTHAMASHNHPLIDFPENYRV